MAALRNMRSLAINLSLVALVILAVEPYGSFGSSRGVPFDFKTDYNGNGNGMCASAVTVHGYKCQEFEVTTDDGYILSVQRIPEGRVGGGGGPNRQPVLLQHGVLVDGVTWLQNSPEQSPAMILADNGFDVWISNIRGTRYSRRHDYWNWTWDDLVVHDLPALLGLVFEQTGQKIHYIGHSMGTLMALASFSEGKQLDKVKSAALLSPVAYLSHMTTALGVVAARAFVSEITTIFGLAEFNPRGEPVSDFLKALCAQAGVDCYDLITALTGKNCCLNASIVDHFLKNEPQSTSTKNLVHLSQTVRDGVLSKYDYGSNDFNQAHYGATKPPRYNLNNIPHDLPLFLSYGGQDALSDVQDVETLLDYLKFHNVDKLHVQYIKDYAHADFIIGITAKDIVYNQIISFFRNQG
ncbi:triacylglycerol lipase 2-like isoform X2 [Lycium ferocissimum]|uniref:triacylglycerol lipase 2-like isoform X2 n=1 Tax=Lycium ferocissimum TaxID=112874 RepID=UPI002814DA0E|nr:triacylglycerol lipase 2-like isoform X2 [Lycium ferocissimum]